MDVASSILWSKVASASKGLRENGHINFVFYLEQVTRYQNKAQRSTKMRQVNVSCTANTEFAVDVCQGTLLHRAATLSCFWAKYRLFVGTLYILFVWQHYSTVYSCKRFITNILKFVYYRWRNFYFLCVNNKRQYLTDARNAVTERKTIHKYIIQI